MVLTRSQSAERERLLNQLDEQRSEGGIEATQSPLENQNNIQHPLPKATQHLPEATSSLASEQQSVEPETMTEPGPVERELIRHERVDFETEWFAGPA